MQIADAANRFLDAHPPWDKSLTEGMRQDFCTIALNYFRQIAVYLAPILPKLPAQSPEFLNLPPLPRGRWAAAPPPLRRGGKATKSHPMPKPAATRRGKR